MSVGARPPGKIGPLGMQTLCNDWNEHYPIGTTVSVQLDDGSIKDTVTLSRAWLMGGHSAMILVNGISGGYSLLRVNPSVPAHGPAERNLFR